jgi:hypothetical protein
MMISLSMNYENPSRIRASFGGTGLRGFRELLASVRKKWELAGNLDELSLNKLARRAPAGK